MTQEMTRIKFGEGPGAYDQPDSIGHIGRQDDDYGPVYASEEKDEAAPKRRDLTVEELKAEQARIEAEIKAKQAAQRKEVIDQIVGVVKTYDIPVDDLIQALGGPKKKPGIKAKAKYRDPETGVTWSGRGKTPTWLRDYPEDQWERFAIPS